jgi:hypothetical protein
MPPRRQPRRTLATLRGSGENQRQAATGPPEAAVGSLELVAVAFLAALCERFHPSRSQQA